MTTEVEYSINVTKKKKKFVEVGVKLYHFKAKDSELNTVWPTKMSLFFFGNNFYKNKETFKISSPQILEVYRILLVKTTLESIMFYYTFSVINTMFVPCTALLYDSTAATQTLKLSTTRLSISSEIPLIFLLMKSCLVRGLFSQTLSLKHTLRK